MAEIAVIIINYNTAELALAAACSVLTCTHGDHDIDLHLVDNASPNGDGAWISQEVSNRGWIDKITLYPEGKNHGFGRGNNLVLRSLAARPAPPKYVFFLNPDAQIKANTISEAIGVLETHPKISVLGCGIDRPASKGAEEIQVSAAFRFPSLFREFINSVNFGPLSRLFPNAAISYPIKTESRAVDWVSGAAFVARFDALRDVDFFDPDYFLYFEEVDLMRRITLSGHLVWHLPSARVTHVAGAATGMKGDRRRQKPVPSYWYRSWSLYYLKNHGRSYALMSGFAKLLGGVINMVIRRIQGMPPDTPPRFFRDFITYVMVPLIFQSHASCIQGAHYD